ncbi:hypothetical protein CRYUN_Cryun06bG0079300 [Craigia yunnanensis]
MSVSMSKPSIPIPKPPIPLSSYSQGKIRCESLDSASKIDVKSPQSTSSLSAAGKLMESDAKKGAIPRFEEVKQSLSRLKLDTVCEEVQCPNIGECSNGGGDGIATARIMLLGDTYRNDLPDGGSGHFALTVQAMRVVYLPSYSIQLHFCSHLFYAYFRGKDWDVNGIFYGFIYDYVQKLKPEIMVECLTSYFRDDLKAVDTLVHSGLDVFAHNIETMKRLQRIVRDPRAGFEQSLSVLRHAKLIKEGMITRSSIMLGLGETDDELKEALADLRAIGVDILTLGQYLQPTPLHLTVEEYVTPEKFAFWKEYGESVGFRYVASGPLVRSSYRAGELFVKTMVKERANQTAASSN